MTGSRGPALTVRLDDVDRTMAALVGGKGANLGELARLEGVGVPAGFCVTVHAYERIAAAASIGGLIAQLSAAPADDRDVIASLSAQIRAAIEQAAMPADVASEVAKGCEVLGAGGRFAVRSSALGEDRAGGSAAGQHDSYLDVEGLPAVLEALRRCWASLFAERAVVYRARNGHDHAGARMAVVIQQMVAADAAGVMFTADPISSNRKIVSIEATRGLGEPLVSGRVSPDLYRVRDGQILPATTTAPEEAPVLDQQAVLELAGVGRLVEEHFGYPQDIEWCRRAGEFLLVQSRPVTALFPIPQVDDDLNHVYVSVGHNQMMTDALKPLGLSFWQMTTPAPMTEVGGRLYVDVTTRLASPAARQGLLELFGRGDPLMADALARIIDRGEVPTSQGDIAGAPPPVVPGNAVDPIPTDPAIVEDLIARTEASIEAAARQIGESSGVDLFDVIAEDIGELRRLLSCPLTHKAAMAGMEATWWLDDHLTEWLGDHGVVDTLTTSAPGNVTSEMGLSLLDVADVIRPFPQVVAHLQTLGRDDHFLAHLDDLEGGPQARVAIGDYLDRYGMRCVGEIDITRTRWAEQPTALVPAILANVRDHSPGERQRRFELGRRSAELAEHDLLRRLRALPDGARKAADAKAMIDRLRTFIGFREYPKYGMIRRYFLYRTALLREADELVSAGVLDEREDAYYLRFDELRDAVGDRRVDRDLIEARKAAQRSFEPLTPPLVLTTSSGGEEGTYRRDDVPPGALAGLAVSAGVVEGRARVITAIDDASLRAGDILVTTHTDPSWSPLFVGLAGLVTEVGGLMTHGAVVAREYGLPAVVGVEHATARIRDGERIRVNGTDGYVQRIDPGTEARPA